MFEIYLKPLQNETFLTLDEVGGECVCYSVCIMVNMIRGVMSRGVSWEMLRLYRTLNSLSVYFPEGTSMNSTRPYLPHYHCDWLEDKLAFPYTDLLASHRDAPIKASLRVSPPFKHSPQSHTPQDSCPLFSSLRFSLRKWTFFLHLKTHVIRLSLCIPVSTYSSSCSMLMTIELHFPALCSSVPGMTSNTGRLSHDTLVDRPPSTGAN